MRASEFWLREWVHSDLKATDLAARFTMRGLEVKSLDKAIIGVVVGQVVEFKNYPDKDNSYICQVSDGTEVVSIVCGAPNIYAGMKTALAKVGAVLPGHRSITKLLIKETESHGMLCSGDELGLNDDTDGILALPDDAPVGIDICSYLKFDDYIFTFDLTPNRPDCLSIYGLARELGVIASAPVAPLDFSPTPASTDRVLPLQIIAQDACPLYLGRTILDVDLNNPTPFWIKNKLQRSGVRSIDPVVDVTNFVLLESGQPAHAFDLDKLNAKIVVRWGTPDESLELLNAQVVKPDAKTLIIADSKGPVGLAGIMGGHGTAICGKGQNLTRNLFIECAHFCPTSIINRARRYGLETEASYRFERGVDPQLPYLAMNRITSLLLTIVGGKPGPVSVARSAQYFPPSKKILLRTERVKKVLGIPLDTKQIGDILKSSNFAIEDQQSPNENSITQVVKIPNWRFDINQEADLIEEIAIFYGYDNFPADLPKVKLTFKQHPERLRTLEWLRSSLTARQYREVINYPFVTDSQHALFSGNESPVRVANPINKNTPVMRSSLIPGLIETAIANHNRQKTSFQLFEIGNCFYKQENTISQKNLVGGIISGINNEDGWDGKLAFDFYDIKGDIQMLLAQNKCTWDSYKHPCLLPGQASAIRDSDSGKHLGFVGQLHPSIAHNFAVKFPVFIFELLADSVCNQNSPEIKAISPYPSIRRDISILVSSEVSADDLLNQVRNTGGNYLNKSFIFDTYNNKTLKNNQKSIGITLIFQSNLRTLRDNDVCLLVDKILEKLKENFKAILRKQANDINKS